MNKLCTISMYETKIITINKITRTIVSVLDYIYSSSSPYEEQYHYYLRQLYFVMSKNIDDQ